MFPGLGYPLCLYISCIDISLLLTHSFGYCAFLLGLSLVLVLILSYVFPRLVYLSSWCVLWVGLPLVLIFTLGWCIPFPCCILFLSHHFHFCFQVADSIQKHHMCCGELQYCYCVWSVLFRKRKTWPWKFLHVCAPWFPRPGIPHGYSTLITYYTWRIQKLSAEFPTIW